MIYYNHLLDMFSKKQEQSFTFDTQHTFEQRKAEADRIKTKYPDRVPIIVEPIHTCKVEIDKKKYLVPNDLTMSQFLYVIRKRLKLSAEKGLFLFVNGSIPNSTTSVLVIYENHKSSDGFLKVNFSEENVFG